MSCKEFIVIFHVVKVAENFIPPLLDAVLLDYQRNVSAAREPEVLSTMATIVNRLEVKKCVLKMLMMMSLGKRFKIDDVKYKT